MARTDRPEQLQRRHRRMAAALAALAALGFVAPALSRASFTSTSTNGAQVASSMDWSPPVVDIVDPGDAIRGTVTITADASDAETGIAQVVLAWAPSGTTTFTVLCTDTTAPYACPFTTAGLPEDEIDLRAVATDRSGFTATDLLEGVLVDNVGPAVSLGTVPGVLSGTVTLTATATDPGSGVASVTIQRAPAGGTTWTPVCTDVEDPFACRLDTTVLTPGLYDLRAVATDVAGNTVTSAVVRNRLVDNTADSVSVDDPGPFLRGTVTITAPASSRLGVTSVRIQRQASGATTWVDLCTDATAPYACAWDTTTVPDGQYSFRAILTNTAGVVTTSTVVGPSQVDNSPVRGFDVQAANVDTVGQIKAGDSLSVTYTRSMRSTSILAGWDGTARAVTVRLRDGASLGRTGADDTIDVFTTTSYATPVNLGTVNLKANQVKAKKVVAFSATMTLQTVTVNGAPATRITLTFGAQTAGTTASLRTVSGARAMVWTPSTAAVDLTGIAVSTAPVTELGALDADL